MKKRINLALDNNDLEVLISQFHFPKEDKNKLSFMYETVLTLLDGMIIYDNAKGKIESIEYEDFFVAIVTLGSGVDELIELYLAHEKVYEAYIVDCIGLKLLSKGYEILVREVENISNKQVIKLDFPGDKYPVGVIEDIVDYLSPEGIEITDNNMLNPLKSAGIILPLGKVDMEDRISKICNSCENCSNVNCAIRLKSKPTAYNYGYARIFNKKN